VTVDASVSAKAEGGEEPVGVPPPDGRTMIGIDITTNEAHHSDMLSDEAQANLDRGPAPGVCGYWRQDFDHCMRDSGHGGEHEYADLTPVPAAVAPNCRRHEWYSHPTPCYGMEGEVYHEPNVVHCRSCFKARDEVRRRRNRGNKQRGAAFERTVAKALGGRRTGPLGGRDDVVGENFAAQTKKTINFSGRQARAYLDDLARIYPTRTALVIHAEPGKDREAIVVLRLSDWQARQGEADALIPALRERGFALTPAGPEGLRGRLLTMAAAMVRGTGVCERPHRNGEAHPHVHFDDAYIGRGRELSNIARALAIPTRDAQPAEERLRAASQVVVDLFAEEVRLTALPGMSGKIARLAQQENRALDRLRRALSGGSVDEEDRGAI